MTFIEPTWFQGAMFYAFWILVPFIIGLIILIAGLFTDSGVAVGAGIVVIIIAIVMALGGASVIWHNEYEVPSVQEKVITVDDWQPTFGRYWGEIKSADDLMLKTTDGELFGNKENFLFQKFDTRDILNTIKPNGTYKIKYYGWREGYNNGVPNILSVEEVINETGTPAHHDISDYMNKRSIIYSDGDDYEDHWK